LEKEDEGGGEMSIATEGLSRFTVLALEEMERRIRKKAKGIGAKVRRHPKSGIDITYADGTKKHYYGLTDLYSEVMSFVESEM
jgi:hypothetical protein